MREPGTPTPGGQSDSQDLKDDPVGVPTDKRSGPISARAASSIVLGALLAVLGMNLSTIRPVFGIDSSFRVGLTEGVLDRMRFGVDIVFPYGPLGFFGGPTFIGRGLLAGAVVYQFVALTVLFTTLVFHLTRLGVARRWTVVVLAPLALAIGITDNLVPEVVSLTVVLALVVLWQADRREFPSPTAWWVLVIAGSVSGAQVLVKFGPGVVACVVVILFAMSQGRRLRQAAIAVAAMAAGFLVSWFGTGQAASSLGPYFRTSLELSSGYQDAQAYGPSTKPVAMVGVMVFVAVAIGVFGAYRWVRRESRAWQVLIPIALTAWFLLKQGLVRWDDGHIIGALLTIGLLVVAMWWERRLVALPLGILLVGALVAFSANPHGLRAMWSDRVDTALVLASGSRQANEVDAAREGLRASYNVPAPVVDALADGSVHAEPWDINAVWGYDLAWNPLPGLQSYSAYTVELDDINATRYATGDGPDGVLFNPSTVDGRYGPWESPAARVALTCNFAAVASADGWTALRRAPDACGPARELSTERVAPGESVAVPEPTTPDALVVARFDLPTNTLGQLIAAVARPLRYPRVTIDGTRYRLVAGTAESAHLVRSPGRIGDRELPHGRVENSSLSFSNLGSGDVVVRFEEIPLTNAG